MDLKLLFLIFAFGTLVVQSRSHAEDEAAEFITETDATITDMLDEINKIMAGPFQHDIGKLQEIGVLYAKVTALCAEAGKFKYNEYENEDIKTALKHIHLNPTFTTDSTDFKDYLKIVFFFNLLKNKPLVSKYQDESGSEKLRYNDIRTILTSTKDLEEVKYYWTAWRDETKDNLKQYLSEFIKMYQKAEKNTGLRLNEIYFADFVDPNFMNEIENVMNELKPYYQQFHTYLRSMLKEHHGDSVATSSGKIRHDVYELFYEELAKGFATTMLNNTITNFFHEQGYTTKRFAEEADAFFKSMSFEQLPSDFWSNRFSNQDENDCEESLILQNTPTTYLRSCPYVNYLTYMTMHVDMSKLHYANQKKDLPFSVFDSYNLDSALGKAIIHSIMSPASIKRIPVKLDDMVEKNLLSGKYFAIMMSLPVDYVHNKVMFDLLSGNIQLNELNEHYWKLMDTYVGVVPPVKRDNNDLDLPLNFYKAAFEKTSASNFFAKIVGYQLYEGLCSRAAKYDPAKPAELHNCDFYGNTIVGSTLKEMMHLGSKKPWKQVLKVVTGNDKGMSILPLVHYHKEMIDDIKKSSKKEKSVIEW